MTYDVRRASGIRGSAQLSITLSYSFTGNQAFLIKLTGILEEGARGLRVAPEHCNVDNNMCSRPPAAQTQQLKNSLYRRWVVDVV